MTDNVKKRREEDDRRKMEESDLLTIELTARKTGLSKYYIRKLITTGQFTDYIKPANKYMIKIPAFYEFLKIDKKGA